MTISKSAQKSSLKPGPVRIGMMSLGCSKTLVDSEHILGKLDRQRYALTGSVDDCDIALLNTCAFIEDAQKESIDRMLELIEMKKKGKLMAVVVMGCMVQRFPKDLQEQLVEVDAFIGSGDYAKIPEIAENVTRGKKMFSVGKPGYLATSAEPRVALTPLYSRYLKISEGCDHICTFCTIPSFRGKHRSRTIEDVVAEAKQLAAQGAKEIILTGQDTTFFGKDTERKHLLPELLQALESVEQAEWFRVLYAYPSCVTTEMMQAIGRSKKVCHYLDMPLQHASDRMLLAMKRGITKRRTTDLIQKFRDTVPDLAIRTTFIVGFPGETEDDFQELLDFIEKSRFDRLGVFTYSREEGTPAGDMPNQVPDEIKKDRLDRAMRLQQEISLENNKLWIGKTLRVLVEKPSAERKGMWVSRSYRDAPDVDANVIIKTKKILKPGTFENVVITKAEDYDLVGEL